MVRISHLSQAQPLHLTGQMTGEEEEQEQLLQEAGRRHSLVLLDVGGEKFSAQRTVLARFPTTRLGRLVRATRLRTVLELCDELYLRPDQPPEFFFDKAGTREREMAIISSVMSAIDYHHNNVQDQTCAAMQNIVQ